MDPRLDPIRATRGRFDNRGAVETIRDIEINRRAIAYTRACAPSPGHMFLQPGQTMQLSHDGTLQNDHLAKTLYPEFDIYPLDKLLSNEPISWDIDYMSTPQPYYTLDIWGHDWKLASSDVDFNRQDAPQGMLITTEPYCLILQISGKSGNPSDDDEHALLLCEIQAALCKGIPIASGINNPKLQRPRGNDITDKPWRWLTRTNGKQISASTLMKALCSISHEYKFELVVWRFGQKKPAAEEYQRYQFSLVRMQQELDVQALTAARGSTVMDFAFEFGTSGGVGLFRKNQTRADWHTLFGCYVETSRYPLGSRLGRGFGGHTVTPKYGSCSKTGLLQYRFYNGGQKHKLLATNHIAIDVPMNAQDKWFYDRKRHLREMAEALRDDDDWGGGRCEYRIGLKEMPWKWKDMEKYLCTVVKSTTTMYDVIFVNADAWVLQFEAAVESAAAAGLFSRHGGASDDTTHAPAWKRCCYYMLLSSAGYGGKWSAVAYNNSMLGIPENQFREDAGCDLSWNYTQDGRRRLKRKASLDNIGASAGATASTSQKPCMTDTLLEEIGMPKIISKEKCENDLNALEIPAVHLWELLAAKLELGSVGHALHELARTVEWRIAPKGRRDTNGIRGWTAKPSNQSKNTTNCGCLGMHLAEATVNLYERIAKNDLTVLKK